MRTRVGKNTSASFPLWVVLLPLLVALGLIGVVVQAVSANPWGALALLVGCGVLSVVLFKAVKWLVTKAGW